MEKVFILLTDTGTVFTTCIKLFTRKRYNHSSIALDQEFANVYSFGRKKIHNPFEGGFVQENLYQKFFLRSKCQIYQIEVSEEQLQRMKATVGAFEQEKNKYRYNLLGLFGLVLHQHWVRENAYFCSQFLAHVFEESGRISFGKPHYFVTPMDLIAGQQSQLIHEGLVSDYLKVQNLLDDRYVIPYISQELLARFAFFKKWKKLLL